MLFRSREGEAGALTDALDELVDGVGRERAAALGGEHKRRIGKLPTQLAQPAHCPLSMSFHTVRLRLPERLLGFTLRVAS